MTINKKMQRIFVNEITKKKTTKIIDVRICTDHNGAPINITSAPLIQISDTGEKQIIPQTYQTVIEEGDAQASIDNWKTSYVLRKAELAQYYTDVPEEAPPLWNNMTKKELMEALREKGIEADPKLTKPKLIELMSE